MYLFITFTDNTGVLLVTTVVGPQLYECTLCEVWFVPAAVGIIQPDGPLALSKTGATWCRQHPPAAQLPTHHLGINQVPVIIANCAPLAPEEDLHPARAGAVPSIDQAYLPLSGCVVAWSGQYITRITGGCIILRSGRSWWKSRRVHCRSTWKTSLCEPTRLLLAQCCKPGTWPLRHILSAWWKLSCLLDNKYKCQVLTYSFQMCLVYC